MVATRSGRRAAFKSTNSKGNNGGVKKKVLQGGPLGPALSKAKAKEEILEMLTKRSSMSSRVSKLSTVAAVKKTMKSSTKNKDQCADMDSPLSDKTRSFSSMNNAVNISNSPLKSIIQQKAKKNNNSNNNNNTSTTTTTNGKETKNSSAVEDKPVLKKIKEASSKDKGSTTTTDTSSGQVKVSSSSSYDNISESEKKMYKHDISKSLSKCSSKQDVLDAFDKEVNMQCLAVQEKIKSIEMQLSKRFKLELIKIANIVKKMNLAEFKKNCKEHGIDLKFLDTFCNLHVLNKEKQDNTPKVNDKVTPKNTAPLGGLKGVKFSTPDLDSKISTTAVKPIGSNSSDSTNTDNNNNINNCRKRGVLTCTKANNFKSRTLVPEDHSAMSVFLNPNAKMGGDGADTYAGALSGITVPLSTGEELLINDDTDMSMVAKGIGKEAYDNAVQAMLAMQEQVNKLVNQMKQGIGQ